MAAIGGTGGGYTVDKLSGKGAEKRAEGTPTNVPFSLEADGLQNE